MNEFELKELTNEEAVNTNGGSILGSLILGICIGGGLALVAQFTHELINGNNCEE